MIVELTLHGCVKNRYIKAYSRPLYSYTYRGIHMLYMLRPPVSPFYVAWSVVPRVVQRTTVSSLHVNALMKYKFPVWRCFRWNRFHSRRCGRCFIVSHLCLEISRFTSSAVGNFDLKLYLQFNIAQTWTLLECKVVNEGLKLEIQFCALFFMQMLFLYYYMHIIILYNNTIA